MRLKKRLLSSVAVLLCVLMAGSVLPLSMASALSISEEKLPQDTFLIQKTTYAVAPGVEETDFITNNKDGSDQNMNYVLTIAPGGSASVIASYKNYDGTSLGLQSVRDQARAAEGKTGYNVVAGVNADFFNMQTGAPTGALVMNSTAYYNANTNRPYFAVLKNGTAVIRDGGVSTADVKEAVGLSNVLVRNGVNVFSGGSTYEDTDQPRTVVGVKQDGSIVLWVVDGRQSPRSSGMTFFELADMMIAMGCVQAGNLDGGGSTTFLTQREGESDLVCRNSPSDGSERSVSSALLVVSTAKPTGVFDHASLSPNNEIYTPESSVTFTATGVDSTGASAPLPADGTFALADDSYGEIDAKSGVFTSNGRKGTVTVNYLSGGQVCGEVSILINDPDTFYVPNAEVSLGFEETTDFGIVAKYLDRTVHMKAGDINWSIAYEGDYDPDVKGEAGVFDGLTFTTYDGVTANASVTAVYAKDPAVTATVRAIIGAMPVVLYDFENYTTDPAAAEQDPNLKYIPSLSMPTFDKSSGVPSPQQAEVFRQQGYPLYNWVNAGLSDPNSMKAEIVSKEDGYPVRFGDHSYRIDYDYSSYNRNGNGNFYVRVTDPTHFFEGSPTALGCWVYVPEGTSNVILYLNCCNKNKDSGIAYAPVSDKVDVGWTGWKYVEFDLTDPTNTNSGPANAPFGFYQGCGVFWISYQPGSFAGETANTLYIDNIQLVYGANTDDINNPEIDAIWAETETERIDIVDGETTFDTNTLTLKSSFRDFDGKYATGIDFDNVSMRIDGVDVTDRAYINEGDEEIYFYDMLLANGEHSIEISVSDLFGNTTTESRSFTVNGGDSMTRVSLSDGGRQPVLGKDFAMTITADNVSDVLSADVQIRVFSYFIQYWNDLRVEPSANYELAGEPVSGDSNTLYSFKLQRKADADPAADDGTIATVYAAIPNNTPEGLEVTYQIAKGALTYASERGEKFASSFSGKIVTSCVSPLVIRADTMLVGTNGGYFTVVDTDGSPVADAEVYLNGALLGKTDETGRIFTDSLVSAVTEFTAYAKKGEEISFTLKGQSYLSGGAEDGAPQYIKLNASTDPSTMQSISWMSSPTQSADQATVLYAEKAAYDSQGEGALQSFTGTSLVSEMASSGSVATNYAVRINRALLTGLKPNTDYVYKVGDGEKMSALKNFSTTMNGEKVNFFVIGDTQATNTSNTDEITKNLASSGVDYSFGIQTGDAVDNGGNYTMWSNIAKVFSGDFLGEQDMIQVLGNHEYYGNEGTASNAAAYFDLPDVKDGAAPLYYSVQYGNVYVAVINYSNMGGYEEAAEWLVQDAQNSTATWKVLTMHQPAYFTNPGGTNAALTGVISSAVDKAGIDFVFSGHDHSYARTEPMTAGQVDRENGAVYYICGSTGEKSYDIVDNESHHYAMLNGDYNAVYLTVSADDESFDVTTHEYTSDGQDVILDSYTMTKEVSCTKDGTHDYVLNGDWLTCAVCGYSEPVGTYTGLVKEGSTGKTVYLYLGEVQKGGWQTIGADTYYFDKDGHAVTGKQKITDNISDSAFNGPTTLEYTFDSTGKLTRGALVTKDNNKYYYIAGVRQTGWFEIDGGWYFFYIYGSGANYGKLLTGKFTVARQHTYTTDKNGKLIRGDFCSEGDGKRYYWAGEIVTGWWTIDGVDYYFDPDNFAYMATDTAIIDGEIYAFSYDGLFLHKGAHDRILKEHKDATCTKDGYDLYVCTYDGAEHDEYAKIYKATGHTDKNEDGYCDVCGTNLWSFFYRILMFIERILDFIAALLA